MVFIFIEIFIESTGSSYYEVNEETRDSYCKIEIVEDP